MSGFMCLRVTFLVVLFDTILRRVRFFGCMSSLTRTIPLRIIYTPCVVTGARIRRVYSYMEYIYTVCSQWGEDSPGLSYMEYIQAVCSHGVSPLTRIILLENTYMPCVVPGEGIRRVYSYMEYIYTVCSHGGEGLSGYIPIWSIYTPCVVTGARARRVYSYMEYIYTLETA